LQELRAALKVFPGKRRADCAPPLIADVIQLWPGPDPMTWLRKHPVVLYGLLMWLLGLSIDAAMHGRAYDEDGLGTALFVSTLVWDVLAFPYSLTRELLYGSNGGVFFVEMDWLIPLLGMLGFVALDLAYQFVRRRLRQ